MASRLLHKLRKRLSDTNFKLGIFAEVSTECFSCHQCLKTTGAFSQNIGKSFVITLRNLSTNKALMRKCCPKVLRVPPLERCLGASIKSLYLNLIFQVLTRNQTQPTRKGCGKNAYACRIVFKNDILTYRSCLCMDTKRSAAYTASFVELATMCLWILSHCSGCMSKSSVANNLPCLASSSHSQKIRLP